ncbi:hypothetical protein Pmani_016676 [Petrolisthes manimaculis]|uniref:Ricin B lectin domain-containing protein n=1 Tax=Petrolisthes manimaculis TaxID=1843537 RepID=A0AAE1UAR5_9EUCA|nr:hypothetical protein Pmani_016676 [Petrolisthes manimaculis]
MQVRSVWQDVCLDTLEREDVDNSDYILALYSCYHSPIRNQLRNNVSQPHMCFDNLQRNEKTPYNMGLYNCHNFLSSSQYMSLSKTGELRREEMCAEIPTYFSGKSEKHGQLIHKVTNKCLERADKQSMDDVVVSDCTNSWTQQWWFDHYAPL